MSAGNALHLVVRGTDEGVHHNQFDGSSWSRWREVPDGARTPSAPAAVITPGRFLLVLIRNPDGSIRSNNHTEGMLNPFRWSGWREVPGGGRTPSAPAAASPETGSGLGALLVVRGTDDGIHFNGLSGGGWVGWDSVPGGGRTPSTPALVCIEHDLPFQSDERHLCVRGTDDGLHHNRFDGSEWSGWSAVPGGGRTIDAPAAVEFEGDLYLFVRGIGDGLHFNRFDGSWSGWSEVPGGGRTPSAPAVTVFEGDLYLFVRGTDDGLHFNRLS
jgi:hypothetical protein